MENLPARYIQSIYKQYTLFIKDQAAQQAAAAEDMIEEMEDGSYISSGRSSKNIKNQTNLTPREEQILAIQKTIEGSYDIPIEAPE